MDEKKIFEISENTRKNSIGQDKVCLYQPKTKKVVLRTKLALLVTVFIFSNMAGCTILENNNNKNKTEIVNDEDRNKKNNGFDIYDIAIFEKQRAMDLLNKYELYDFKNIGLKRDYNYSIEDYKKITELDETYLYALKSIMVEEDFIIVLNSLGYNDLNDFLIKNNYTNSNGKVNTSAWAAADAEYISEIMKELEMSLKGEQTYGK